MARKTLVTKFILIYQSFHKHLFPMFSINKINLSINEYNLSSRNKSKLYIKRFIDISFSSILLVVLSPIFLITMIIIKTQMGSPIFFFQQRAGFKNKIFTIIKYRTMVPPKEGEDWVRTDNTRLTKLGRLLRKTSIDELPELVNVLKGEMSIVGPRPLLPEYLPKYSENQKRRHAVKPGITGLAQVMGRQKLSFSKRIEYDVWYVDHWNLILDAKIIFKTISTVLTSSGVYSGQEIAEVDDIGLLSRDRENNN